MLLVLIFIVALCNWAFWTVESVFWLSSRLFPTFIVDIY